MFQEKERLSDLEKRYHSLTGGKSFPRSPTAMREVSVCACVCAVNTLSWWLDDLGFSNTSAVTRLKNHSSSVRMMLWINMCVCVCVEGWDGTPTFTFIFFLWAELSHLLKAPVPGSLQQGVLNIQADLLWEDVRTSQNSFCRASPSYLHPSPPCQLYPSSPTEVTRLMIPAWSPLIPSAVAANVVVVT